MCAVVKANGYGHGVIETSKACLAAGAEFFWQWLCLPKQWSCGKQGFTCPILILGWTPEEGYEQAIQQQIRLAVFDAEEAARLNAKALAMGKKGAGASQIGYRHVPDWFSGR